MRELLRLLPCMDKACRSESPGVRRALNISVKRAHAWPPFYFSDPAPRRRAKYGCIKWDVVGPGVSKRVTRDAPCLVFRKGMNEFEFQEVIEACVSDAELNQASLERIADNFPDPSDFSVTITRLTGEEFDCRNFESFRLWHAARKVA